MSQAIVTRELGWTNTKPNRIKATCQAKSVTISWPDGLIQPKAHALAALKLKIAMQWNGKMVGGQIPNGDYVWVFTKGSEAIG